jgi:hypothetical protein
VSRPRDHDRAGPWSGEGIVARYRAYCRELHVEPRIDPTPPEHEQGDVRWVYPAMQKVIEGIEAGDPACIALGLDLLEQDQEFPFGKILKSNTARALRQAPLTEVQVVRIRKRVVDMLLAGNVPHEFKQYARLLRKIGVGELWPVIEAKVARDNPHVMRWYEYLRQAGQP